MEEKKETSTASQPQKIPSIDKIERRSSISKVKRRDSLLKDPFFTQSVAGSPEGYSFSVDKWPEHDKTKPTPSVDISNLKKRGSQSNQSFFLQSACSSSNISVSEESAGPDSLKTKPISDTNTEHDPACGGKV